MPGNRGGAEPGRGGSQNTTKQGQHQSSGQNYKYMQKKQGASNPNAAGYAGSSSAREGNNQGERKQGAVYQPKKFRDDQKEGGPAGAGPGKNYGQQQYQQKGQKQNYYQKNKPYSKQGDRINNP